MMGMNPAALMAAAGIVMVGLAAARHQKPLRAGLSSVLGGVGALGAVNLLAEYTGVSLGLNLVSWFSAVVLGIPGVTTLLLLKLIFGLP